MAKEPYKDPFANLPRRVCGVVVEESTRVSTPDKPAAAKKALDKAARTDKVGPLKRPKKNRRRKPAAKRRPKSGKQAPPV